MLAAFDGGISTYEVKLSLDSMARDISMSKAAQQTAANWRQDAPTKGKSCVAHFVIQLRAWLERDVDQGPRL